MNKQTAVEWLYAHLLPYLESTDPKVMHHFRLCLNEAKAMEREQITDAVSRGWWNNENGLVSWIGEDYYNETYKGGEQ